jgi:hypothetical protein
MSFEDLPLSIFPLIKDFILRISIENRYITLSFRESCIDWRSFLNCNKSWMHEVKQHFVYYNLNRNYSDIYLTSFREDTNNQQDEVSKDIERLKKIIINPKQQIGIRLVQEAYLLEEWFPIAISQIHTAHLHWFFRSSLNNLNCFDGLFCLEIEPIGTYEINLSQVKNLEFFCVKCPLNTTNSIINGSCNATELYLGNSRKIPDLTFFIGLQKVDLCNNKYIQDVSSLGNVKYLNLRNCPGVIDVSMLGKLKFLNISYCVNVIDVSALENVRSLDITGCDRVEDVSALINVRILSMDNKSQKILQLLFNKNRMIIEWKLTPNFHENILSLKELKLMSLKENKKIIFSDVSSKFDFQNLMEFLFGYIDISVDSINVTIHSNPLSINIFSFVTIRI